MELDFYKLHFATVNHWIIKRTIHYKQRTANDFKINGQYVFVEFQKLASLVLIHHQIRYDALFCFVSTVITDCFHSLLLDCPTLK